MGQYQGYERYKDSGVEWLGKIPEHWDVKRLKNIASCNDEALGEIPVQIMRLTMLIFQVLI